MYGSGIPPIHLLDVCARISQERMVRARRVAPMRGVVGGMGRGGRGMVEEERFGGLGLNDMAVVG